MDIWTKDKRSEVMSRIRGKNTKPELILRSNLFKQGFRYRVNSKNILGKPDIVLPKYKTVIFVHGCFWHQHEDCNEGRIPTSNIKYWQKKFAATKERDNNNILELKKMGWNVIVVWECEIEKNLEETLHTTIANITSVC